MATLLDTNFLMIPVQNRVDVYRLIENPFTLDVCVMELEKLAADEKDAKLALDILKMKKPEIREGDVSVSTDKAIIKYALENKCRVATNDKELIEKLKKNKIKVMRLRQDRYIVED